MLPCICIGICGITPLTFSCPALYCTMLYQLLHCTLGRGGPAEGVNRIDFTVTHPYTPCSATDLCYMYFRLYILQLYCILFVLLSDTATTEYTVHQREELISVVSPIYCENTLGKDQWHKLSEFGITHGDLCEW